MPSSPTVTSLRNLAPWTAMLATGWPVRRLRPRRLVMSATQMVSPWSAMPLGPSSSTPSTPPTMNLSESTLPSPLSREMYPLPSLSNGDPLMLATYHTSSSASYLTDSGCSKPSTVVGPAAAAGVVAAESGDIAVVVLRPAGG